MVPAQTAAVQGPECLGQGASLEGPLSQSRGCGELHRAGVVVAGVADRTGLNLQRDSTHLHRVKRARLGCQCWKPELPLGPSQAGEWMPEGRCQGSW